MKVQSVATSSSRNSLHGKKRSPANASAKKRDSPSFLKGGARRQSPSSHALSSQRQQRLSYSSVSSDPQNLFEIEYRDEIISYMHEMELRTMASVELIDMQPELQWYMRPYLVDFLIEIHQQHRLRPETLYLALNIVDRYVSRRIVFKKHYQLVGCAALWIAAKFEDPKDRVPTVQQMCSMCCDAYDESAFIQMEGHVLSTISWIVGHPTAESWLRTACMGPHGQEEPRSQHIARFLMEITLFHRAFILFKPSDLATGCLLLARFMLGKPRRLSDENDDVLRIVTMLDAHLAEHLDQVSSIVVKKYAFPFYSRASTSVRQWYLSGHRFSYFGWPSPKSSPSSASSPNSCRYFSSPTSSASSDDSYDEQPLTPSHVPSACAESFPCPTSTSAKENIPYSLPVRHTVLQPIRPVLSDANWEINIMPVQSAYAA